MSGAPALRVPRRLLLTLRLGEMPEHVPSMLACRRHGVAMSARIDGGVLDRLLRHHGGAARCARLHNARTPHSARPEVAGSRRYDDVEQLSGVARVLRVEVADDRAVPVLVEALAQVANVERVQPDRVCTNPHDAAPPGEPHAAGEVDAGAAHLPREQIRLPQALAYEPGDPSVIVGLADTGVIPNHAELALRLRRGFDTVDLDAATIGSLTLVGDNTLRDELAQDEVGHGTGCAGIMRAGGVRLPPGALGLCELTPVRVLGAALSGARRIGIGALSNIDAGMKRLIDLGVKVVNMSFGTPESVLEAGAPRPHEEVIHYALARGVLLVAASGNSGIAERLYPAAQEGVIAVGSVDHDLRPSQFSTRGEHVAVCAPGRDIWTCGLQGYQRATGTSFAAPFVSALCGLMVARAERRAWPLSPALARRVLLETAQPFRAPAHGCGAGVVDALAALQRLDTAIDTELASNQ
jgi:subtilisin family serine protease